VLAHVELRRAHEVPDVLDDHQIQGGQVQSLATPVDHGGIEMALAPKPLLVFSSEICAPGAEPRGVGCRWRCPPRSPRSRRRRPIRRGSRQAPWSWPDPGELIRLSARIPLELEGRRLMSARVSFLAEIDSKYLDGASEPVS